MTASCGPTLADFVARVGAEFALQLPDGDQAPLVLTECTDDGAGAFSLIFKAGARAPHEQASYQLSADGFGPETVFLVPVALRPHDTQFPLEYQAIFNPSPTMRPDPGSIHRLEEKSR